MQILGDLDGCVLLGSWGSALNGADGLALLEALAGNEFRVEAAFGMDDFKKSRVGGLVGLLHSLGVVDGVFFDVYCWHVVYWLYWYVLKSGLEKVETWEGGKVEEESETKEFSFLVSLRAGDHACFFWSSLIHSFSFVESNLMCPDMSSGWITDRKGPVYIIGLYQFITSECV